jgi:hypothetical protein
MQINLSKDMIETVRNALHFVDETSTKQAKSHLGAGGVEFIDAVDLFNDLYCIPTTSAAICAAFDEGLTHAERDEATHIAANSAYMARLGKDETR